MTEYDGDNDVIIGLSRAAKYRGVTSMTILRYARRHHVGVKIKGVWHFRPDELVDKDDSNTLIRPHDAARQTGIKYYILLHRAKSENVGRRIGRLWYFTHDDLAKITVDYIDKLAEPKNPDYAATGIGEAARLLNVSKQAVWERAKRYKIGVRDGRAWFFTSADLEELRKPRRVKQRKTQG